MIFVSHNYSKLSECLATAVAVLYHLCLKSVISDVLHVNSRSLLALNDLSLQRI